MDNITLSILIPTYNRDYYVIKNIELLSKIIRINKIENEVEIVISNNNSTDLTKEKIDTFVQKNDDIKFLFNTQDKNNGLEKNALFTLKMARGIFVMYLGDDDFLDLEYFKNVVKYISEIKKLNVIIPNNYPIDTNGIIIGEQRDKNKSTLILNSGFITCYKYSWRAHQLSGLVLRREGLYEAYIKHKVSNIYPFIFFVAYLSLHGKVVHLVENPIKITTVNQKNKDWNYGNDGLINDVFDNYNKLDINVLYKTLLQIKFLYVQPWRIFIGKNGENNKSNKIKHYFRLFLTPNTAILFKILLPGIIFILFLRLNVYQKVHRYLKQNH